MRHYDTKTIADALRAVMMPVRQQEDYPATKANVAYLVYDIGTELKLPERSIYDILGYRGYLYVAKTRYYATPEGKQALEEALACLLDEDEEVTTMVAKQRRGATMARFLQAA